LNCLVGCCCRGEEQEEDEEEEMEGLADDLSSPVRSSTIHRQAEEQEGEDNCCNPDHQSSSPALIHEFFRALANKWRKYDSVANADCCIPHSPLRPAISFDSSTGTPSICADEIVLPGSALQKDMACCMAKSIESQGDECVICMEGFDPTNPRMPTLCGCGTNKTYFHLPCLYQWVEQNAICPSCRQLLTWEEF
jgi:hypothetical protein